MRGAKACILLGITVSSNFAHKPPSLANMHFGTYQRFAPDPESEISWTEITFFPGDLFTIRNADSACEDMFGHGSYVQKKDTLILTSLRNWTTLGCKFELMDNLVLDERRYLVRDRDSSSFEILYLGKGHKKVASWRTLWKYGSKPSKLY
jgi:hypothetical protein